jgi:hypothetical protein
MSEQFVCLNCLSVGELNTHGRCGTCDSDGVISAEIVRSSASTAKSGPYNTQKKDSTIYGFLVTHPSGFESFVSNPNKAIAYSEATDPLTRWYISPNTPHCEPESLKLDAMTRDEYIEWIKRERV